MAAKKNASGSQQRSDLQDLKNDAENQGYTFKDRTGELSKWSKGHTVQGTFTGFKNGKKFSNKSEPSVLCKFRVDGQTHVYACPAILQQMLEDISPGTDVLVICLGQTKEIKDRKEPAWDFEVATK